MSKLSKIYSSPSRISGYDANRLSTLANFASYINAVAIINLSNGSLCTGDKLTALQDISGVNGNKQIPEGANASRNHSSAAQGRSRRPFSCTNTIS